MKNASIFLRCNSCKTINKVPSDKLQSHPKCGKCKSILEFPIRPIVGNSRNFNHEVMKWPGFVLLDFWAKWCGACRMIEPVINEIASERAGRLKIVKVDVDDESQIAKNFNIHATPTLALFKNGKNLNSISGALSKQQLEQWIDSSAI